MGALCAGSRNPAHKKNVKGFEMKIHLTIEDHILVGHWLKVAHHAILKADNILANKHGKSKSPRARLVIIREELLQLRCDIEEVAYRDLATNCDPIRLRQKHLGPLDKDIFKTGEDIFI